MVKTKYNTTSSLNQYPHWTNHAIVLCGCAVTETFIFSLFNDKRINCSECFDISDLLCCFSFAEVAFRQQQVLSWAVWSTNVTKQYIEISRYGYLIFRYFDILLQYTGIIWPWNILALYEWMIDISKYRYFYRKLSLLFVTMGFFYAKLMYLRISAEKGLFYLANKSVSE